MASRIRALDWVVTAAGPAQRWPAGLRTAVGLVLRSEFPPAADL
jgi:hypothetical protein